MGELPEDKIRFAETSGSVMHVHDPAIAGDRRLLIEHLVEIHKLEAPDGLSDSTLAGLHDRLHDETDSVHRGR